MIPPVHSSARSSPKDPLKELIRALSRLPGIGPKSASRVAHHLLRTTRDECEQLCRAILDVKDLLFHCSICRSITAVEPCAYCTDPERDRSRICVVEEPFNIEPIERTREFRGLYHVLLGALAPQRGIGPEQLEIDRLIERLDGVEEVILATNPNVEGEATALYIARLLAARDIPTTRLAFGLPVGGDLDYIDEVTLARSLLGRQKL